MFEINFIAVITAAVAAFVVGAVWNGMLFGNIIMKLQDPGWYPRTDSPRPPVGKLLIEFGRCFVVAFLLAYLVVQMDLDSWMSALQLGVLMWIGFPAMILVGAVLWENEPLPLAAIHAGDWLIKMMIMAVIISFWL